MFGMPGTELYLGLNSPNSNRGKEPPSRTSPTLMENKIIIMGILIITIIIY